MARTTAACGRAQTDQEHDDDGDDNDPTVPHSGFGSSDDVGADHGRSIGSGHEQRVAEM